MNEAYTTPNGTLIVDSRARGDDPGDMPTMSERANMLGPLPRQSFNLDGAEPEPAPMGGRVGYRLQPGETWEMVEARSSAWLARLDALFQGTTPEPVHEACRGGGCVNCRFRGVLPTTGKVSA
jgi:broad specificity phosphatase PhoE